jgi:hypothetical protein
MNTMQLQEDFPEVQAAIYRVALSLDAFLLNGIPSGVIHRTVFDGFVEKTAGNLLGALAQLETQVTSDHVIGQHRAREILAALRVKSQELIDVVTGLTSFRTLSLQELRSTISRIPLVRGECVRLIEELEACLGTPKPFYQSRPSYSTVAMDDFLANLEQLFTEARAAAGERA